MSLRDLLDSVKEIREVLPGAFEEAAQKLDGASRKLAGKSEREPDLWIRWRLDDEGKLAEPVACTTARLETVEDKTRDVLYRAT